MTNTKALTELTKALTEQAIWDLRNEASLTGDCDLSRLCSEALWGTHYTSVRLARRKIAKILASR